MTASDWRDGLRGTRGDPVELAARAYLESGGEESLIRICETELGGYDEPPYRRTHQYARCGYTVSRYTLDRQGHQHGHGLGGSVGTPESIVAAELARRPLGAGERLEVTDPWGKVVAGAGAAQVQA